MTTNTHRLPPGVDLEYGYRGARCVALLKAYAPEGSDAAPAQLDAAHCRSLAQALLAAAEWLDGEES